MFRILIIDPDPFSCRSLKELLSKAGYLVDSAANGKLALEHLRTHPPRVQGVGPNAREALREDLHLLLERQLHQLLHVRHRVVDDELVRRRDVVVDGDAAVQDVHGP